MTFEFTHTEDGFRIRDTIENTWSTVAAGHPLDPRPASTDVFHAPLDTAVAVTASELEFSQRFHAAAQTADGTFVDRTRHDTTLDLAPGTYILDTSLGSFKLYLAVEDAAIRAHTHDGHLHLAFDRETTVTFGLRSFHQRPAATVAVSQDPRELMRGISTFGSALKTHSPERAFPTLRGHPPELAVRGRTAIPDDIDAPDTGVTIEVEPSYDQVFTVAPLAYYLGATVEPGHEPCIRAGDAVHSLDPGTFATDVRDLLRHVFLLDCVVRTAGLYPLDLHEHHRLAERTTIDRAQLYDLPLDERTARYLEYPTDLTADRHRWHLGADVDPIPLNGEALPYLAYRLAAIRSPTKGAHRDPVHSSSSALATSDAGAFVPTDDTDHTTVVDPEPFDTTLTLWFGNGIPARGTKPTLGAYLRSIEFEKTDTHLERHVVVTGDADPDRIRDEYGRIGAEPTPVTVHVDPTTSDLRDLFTRDLDFLHYRGETTPSGFDCIDGTLDIRTLPGMNVSAFLLDGATSYRQGLSLIHAGGIAGVVTTDTTDGDTGRILARLIDAGFSVESAVDVLHRLDGDAEYAVVGDGGHQVSQAHTAPHCYVARPDRSTETTAALDAHCYTTTHYRTGITIEFEGDGTGRSRIPGYHELEFTHDQLEAFLDDATEPLVVDGDLHWLDELSATDVWELLERDRKNVAD